MQKKQIGIVVAGIALVTLGIIITAARLDHGDGSAIAAVNGPAADAQLPSVPQAKENKEYESKLDQIESEQQNEKNTELKEQVKPQIDLDIFKVGEEKENPAITPVTETKQSTEITFTESKQFEQQKKPTVKTTVATKTKMPVESKPALVKNTIQEKETDPDLAFSSNDFSTKDVKSSEINEPEHNLKANPATAFQIKAVVHSQATVTNGTRVVLRTTDDFSYEGKTIPKNTFLTATVTFNNYRVQLTLSPILYTDGTAIARRLGAYDGNDLVRGLYARELLENKASSETADGVVDEVNNKIPSGVVRSVVKSFGKGKLKEQSVTLRINHPVIIQE
jgi:hypothetical protein